MLYNLLSGLGLVVVYKEFKFSTTGEEIIRRVANCNLMEQLSRDVYYNLLLVWVVRIFM